MRFVQCIGSVLILAYLKPLQPFLMSFRFDLLLSLAPENQLFSNCSILSDMFSLGLVMCTIFNQGHAMIQANNSASTYLKQLDYVSTFMLDWTELNRIDAYYIPIWEVKMQPKKNMKNTTNTTNHLNLRSISSCLIPFKRCFPACRCHYKKLYHVWRPKSPHHDQPLNSCNWSNILGKCSLASRHT